MFTLDENFEKTSTRILQYQAKSGPVFDCRMVNDGRYFWLLIIPEVPDIAEIHELPAPVWAELSQLTRHLSQVMKTATSATKINSAAIGNVVRMLHVHIVARHTGDDAWPHPVWGRGAATPMTKTIATWRAAVIRDGVASFQHDAVT